MMEKYVDYHEVDPVKLYQRGLSVKQVLGISHIAQRTLHRLLKESGIPRRGRAEAQLSRASYSGVFLSKRQEQIIIGSLLGDSSLDRIKSPFDNSRMKVSHRDKDKEYLDWVHSELRSTGLFPNEPHQRVDLLTWSLRSRSHPLFTEYRKLFYPDGTKVVPQSILERLDGLGLAVWYMDDGSLSWGRNHQLRIYTDGFSLSENERIIRWFRRNYHLTFRAHRRDSSSGTYYLILSGKPQIKEFLLRVQDFVSPLSCMRRKINVW